MIIYPQYYAEVKSKPFFSSVLQIRQLSQSQHSVMVNLTTMLYCDPNFKTLSSDWSKGMNFQLNAPHIE